MRAGRTFTRAPDLLLIHFVLSILLAAGRARGENVALGKTTFQSSDYTVHVCAVLLKSSYATDGKYDCRITCTAMVFIANTLVSTSPWWTVDLGRSYEISYVKIFNRVDCCPERLHDFNVKVLHAFNPSNPNAEAGALCAHHTGAAGNKVTVTCSRKPRGSFVMIQIPGNGETLGLCEVEVHPNFGDYNKDFTFLSEQRFSSSIIPIQELQMPNHQRCCLACLGDIQCNSAEYQKASKNCKLFRETPTSTTTEAAVGYTIYN